MLPINELKNLFEYRDGELYWRVSPNRSVKVGDKAGYLTSKGYVHARVDGKRFAVHRAVYLLHKGVLPEYVDHINGDRSDNRIENLREATRSENMQNCQLSVSNSSGVKGVHWSKASKKWKAQLRVQGVVTHVGYFTSLDEATEALRMERAKYHGEFARHA